MMWSLKTGGLWWQVLLYLNVGSARKVWYYETGGLSCQWSVKTVFYCIPSQSICKTDYIPHIGTWRQIYSGPCILRPPLQPERYGLKLKVVLKWRDIYIENIRMVSLTAGLKIEGIVKWRGLESQVPLYCDTAWIHSCIISGSLDLYWHINHIIPSILQPSVLKPQWPWL